MNTEKTPVEKWSPIVDFHSFLNEEDKQKCANKLNEIEAQFLRMDPNFNKNKDELNNFIRFVTLCVEEYKNGNGENLKFIFDGELFQKHEQ